VYVCMRACGKHVGIFYLEGFLRQRAHVFAELQQQDEQAQLDRVQACMVRASILVVRK
jgi:hypothetical protein